MRDLKVRWLISNDAVVLANSASTYPGAVADVGDLRLSLRRTNREKANKWRLYMEIRTHKEYGVEEELKRGVCVAEFEGSLTQEEAINKANQYLLMFIGGLVSTIME